MDAEDPRNKAHSAHKKNSTSSGSHTDSGVKIGSHLAPMSQLDALRRVEGQYRSNNDPVTHISTASSNANGSTSANQSGNVDSIAQSLLLHQLAQPLNPPVEVAVRASLFNYSTVEELATALTNMHQGIKIVNIFVSIYSVCYQGFRTHFFQHSLVSLQQTSSPQLANSSTFRNSREFGIDQDSFG